MSMQIKARVTQISDSASEAQAREHKTLIDRPQSKGGSNQGAMGGELMLMGIGGCFMSNLLANAKARELAVSDLAIEVTATMDGTPPRFAEIDLMVSGRYPDRATMLEIVASAEKNCISINTVRAAVALTVRLD